MDRGRGLPQNGDVKMEGMLRYIVGLAMALGSAASAAGGAPNLMGFGTGGSEAQLKLEAKFDTHLAAERLEERMRRLAGRPHHAGSAAGKTNAHWIASEFERWGFETKIEIFQFLFPTPKVRDLELVEPTTFRAALREPPVAPGATSSGQPDLLPPYNAYSPDGDVTAELVYVNQGLPRDYETLERMGIDVAGKIVIARYGGSWRGIKPKVAAEHGALGCILYSDPRDDGYFQGDPYPAGAFKNVNGVQRGSVVDMPLFPGDPLTPGVGATKNARRLAIDETTTLAGIPVLPISHGDARPLLAALGGAVAPPDWRGALPMTYHLGPGPAKVHLRLSFEWSMAYAYDVIATLTGDERPEQWILRGNHHDAWVNGAHDPVSGLVAMMEEARAIGRLAQDGWRPRRTIVYAAWDAEEPGLIGSTEWVETHAEALRQRAAVYINTDSNGRGFLNAGGSHTLEAFFEELARSIVDPQKQISVAARAHAYRMVRGTPEQREVAQQSDALPLEALGSGSDYTPFLQHLGIASLNIGYGGENRGGEYHSRYDTVDHYTRFGDPGFRYGIALAQTAGHAVLRLAEADLLPFEFGRPAATFSGYVDELIRLTDEMREEHQLENRLIREGHYEAVADPTKTWITPEPRDPVPHLSFAPLRTALTELHEGARRYGVTLEERFSAPTGLPAARAVVVDEILFRVERALTREEGLPGRPWFRHQTYAPGFYTGYGVKTLPGVREAIEQRDWALAERQIGLAAATFSGFTAEIDRATAALGKE